MDGYNQEIFFQNQDTFFKFRKRPGETSPPTHAGCALVSLMDINHVDIILWNRNKIWIFTLSYVFFICQLNATLNIDGPNFIAAMIYKKILLYNAYQD